MILKPGEWTVYKGTESKLLEKVKFWTSFPMEVEKKEGETRMRPDKSAPLGIHFLRAFTGDKITPWQTVILDDLPLATRKQRDNDSPAKAWELKGAGILSGTIQANRSDFYRLKLAKGEAVTMEVIAQRLLSKLDPHLRVLDEQGRQLAFREDEPGLGKDTRLRYMAKAEQTIVIEVRDSSYQGGDEYAYVLRVGDFPRVNFAYPGQDKKPVWVGPDADKVSGAAKGPEAGLAQWYAPRLAANKPAALVLTPTDANEPVSEAEPNDERAKANSLTLPASVYGRFEKAGDVDWYVWDAKKGEKFLVRAQTRSISLPADVRLSAHGMDGKTIGTSKVATEDEGVLDVVATADGKLSLKVSEIAGLGGPELGYRLNIQPAKTGFVATTEVDKLVLAPGGTADLKLAVERQGYDGEIEFTLQPKIAGLSLSKVTVEAKKKEGKLQVKAEDNLAPGSIFQVRVQSVNPAAGYVQSYATLTNQLGPSSTMAAVLDGWITVAIQEKTEPKEKPKSP